MGGKYRAGRVGLFDTTLTGSVDTERKAQVGVKLSADTSEITDYFLGKQKPFGKAKGGKVKPYAKGGGVRKPKLK